MSLSDIQGWIGVVGVVCGAGIAYGALVQRIKSLEDRVAAQEKHTEKIESDLSSKLDRVLAKVETLSTMVTRLEERVSKTL